MKLWGVARTSSCHFQVVSKHQFKVVLVMVMVMGMVVVLVMVMVLVVGMAMIMVGDWQELVLAFL